MINDIAKGVFFGLWNFTISLYIVVAFVLATVVRDGTDFGVSAFLLLIVWGGYRLWKAHKAIDAKAEEVKPVPSIHQL